MKASIAKNTAIDSGAQAAAMVISLVTGVVLARFLGAEGRGAYVLATSFAGLFLLGFVNMGFELAASVLTAKTPERIRDIHGVLLTTAVAMLAVMMIVVALALEPIRAALFPALPSAQFAVILLTLPFWSYQYGCFGLLIGQGRVRGRAFFELGLSLLQNALVVALLVFTMGRPFEERIPLLVYTFFGIILLSSVILPVMLLRDTLPRRFPSRKAIGDFYRYGFWVYLGNMGGNLGQKIDQFLVQRIMVDTAAFGVYTLATSLTQRTRIFPQALSRSSYAKICSLPEPEAAALVASTFRQMLLLGVILLAVGSVLSPLIPMIYTAEFAPAVIPFIIFLAGRLFHNCSWMLANYFSGTLARPKLPAMVNWCLLPVQAVLAWIALQSGGLIAVAMVTSASYFILFLVFLILFLRHTKAVSAKNLFLLGRADWQPWLRLFRKSK